MEYRGVMVVGEQRFGSLHPVTYELLARGRALADKLGVELSCVVMGHQFGSWAEEIVARGADVVYLVDGQDLEWFLPRAHAHALVDLIHEAKPEIVLAAATTTGRTLMPLVAAKVGAGLTADCTELDIDIAERLLLQTRPAIGGNIMATIKTPTARPQMATVRPKSMRPLAPDPSRTGRVVAMKWDGAGAHADGAMDAAGVSAADAAGSALETMLEFVRDDTQTVNVQDAEVVVAGGKGMKTRDGFKLVEELADLFGAAVGATRDVVDLGWTTYPHQIGLSGKTVSPRLYIALGISGSVQHLAGMQTSGTIVAINKDKDAQMLKVADFGIVGDVFEVVPQLIDGIRQGRR